jgi:type IV fimbrial biogenesis protein FimT
METLNVRPKNGFTLIELVVTLMVLVLIITFGVPSLQNIVNRSEARSEISRLHIGVSQAHMHAINNTTHVTICPLNSNNRCTLAWSDKVTIFEDINDNQILDTNEAILFSFDAISDSRISRSYGKRRAITFNPMGHSFGYNGTLRFCLTTDQILSGGLIIHGTGRVRPARDTNSDGIAEDSQGRDIRCS